MISRAEWGARAPRGYQPISPRGLAVHHPGSLTPVRPHSQCIEQVQGYQNFHMDSRKWNDIAYSFLICQHASVFVGRGFSARTAAQGTDSGNSTHLAVCVLITRDGVTAPIVDGMRELYDEFRFRNIPWNLAPHSAFHATECPGDALRAAISNGVFNFRPIPKGFLAMLSDAEQQEMLDHLREIRRIVSLPYGGTPPITAGEIDRLNKDAQNDEHLHELRRWFGLVVGATPPANEQEAAYIDRLNG